MEFESGPTDCGGRGDRSRFTRAVSQDAPRLPPASIGVVPGPSPDRMLLWSLGIGTAFYVLVPEIAGTGYSGYSDEVGSALAGISGAVLATLRKVPALCASDWSARKEGKKNTMKGAAGGLTLGVGISQATASALMSPVDLGLIYLSTAVGMLFAHALNRVPALKECPFCAHLGRCSQRVCRSCYKLFYPSTELLDEHQTPIASWYRAASYLQSLGLTYLDAECLAVSYGREWGIRRGEDITVRTKAFHDWIIANLEIVECFVGKGVEEFSGQKFPAKTVDVYLKKWGC